MGQTTKRRKKAAMPKRITAPKASRMAVMSVSVVDGSLYHKPLLKSTGIFVIKTQ
jgi:hypothetical protein